MLSFDSVECVKVEQCTKQRPLVVVLTVIYWMAVVLLAIVMMYRLKVQVGYLFVLSYYFGILDILVNESLHSSQVLLITNSVVSSFFKITFSWSFLFSNRH